MHVPETGPHAALSDVPHAARPHRERAMSDVTVAIPVRDGGELFAGVLRALSSADVAHELLVCDSGSQRRLGRARSRSTAHA